MSTPIINKANQVIANFQQHSTGKLNLWTSIVTLSQKYVITVEAQKRVGTGITTAIVLQLPFTNYSYEDYLKILMTLQAKWQIPVLCHQFPRVQLNALRNQYGSNIIRDDVMRRWR